MSSEGEQPLPLNQTAQPEIKCPICGENLDEFDEDERNMHVMSCLPQESVPSPNRQNFPPTIFNTSSSDNPFIVTCPYPYCNLQFEARDFPFHVTSVHFSGPQNFACPLCTVTMGIVYKVTTNTNLFNHVTNTHKDLVSLGQFESLNQTSKVYQSHAPNPHTKVNMNHNSLPQFQLQPQLQPQQQQFAPQQNSPALSQKTKKQDTSKKKLETLYADTQPSDYLAEIVVQSEPGLECIICFTEYAVNDTVARLQCLCLFHQSCIESWFNNKGKRFCPVHQNDT